MEEAEKVRVHALFTGIVQGVFFRANTQRQAQRLGLRGWVMNLPNGRVEALIEGERHDIAQLILFCQNEIPAAQVDMVDIDEHEFIGDYDSFDILR